jgi:hypothetical protein
MLTPKQQRAAKQKAWYYSEAGQKYAVEYRQRPEVKLAKQQYMRQWRERHREQRAEYRRRYAVEHRERERETDRLRFQRDHAKRLEANRLGHRSRRLRGIPSDLLPVAEAVYDLNVKLYQLKNKPR